jgi:hypothetical protein
MSDLGSPPRTAWKNVWGNGSNASTASAGLGKTSAASERLYKSAETRRAARERLQREAAEPRASGGSRASSSADIKRQTDIVAERFSHVLASTAAGRHQREVVTLACVNGGETEGDRVRDLYNYGDMLFQEGMMQRQRKEDERQRELQRREEEELRRTCPFKPTLSAKAASNERRGHISERVEDVARAHRERMQALAEVVRSETERDLTFRPQTTCKKSKALVAGYGNFLDEMKARDELHERRLRELRASRAEEERRDFTFKPTVSSRASSVGDQTSGSLAAHDRLYVQHTASYEASLAPPTTSDAECTFRPNAGKAAAFKSRAELEEHSDALHRDAHNRRIRRQILQEQMDAELTEVRNERKMSAKSDRLSFMKLQRDVLEIFDRLGATERGLRYDELTAALVELSVLKHAHADGAVLTVQAKEEVLLLQRLWRHLTAKPDVPESVGTAEGGAAPIADAEPVVHQTALLTFLADALVPPDDGEPPILDGDPGLHAQFRSFYRNTLAYKNIRNLKSNSESQLASREEYSFEPHIDSHSRRLERARESVLQCSDPNAPRQRHDQLFRHAKSLEHKQEMGRIRAHEGQMQECSFRPKINKVQAAWAEPAARPMGDERFEHLHMQAMAAKEKGPSSIELEVAQECTFKPRVIS